MSSQTVKGKTLNNGPDCMLQHHMQKRLLLFCSLNSLYVANTSFRHKMIHNKTWKSHDDQTENEIDFICVSNKLSYVIQNSRNYKGVDISSDHQLFRSVLKIKAGTVL